MKDPSGCFYTIEAEDNKNFIFYRKFVSFFSLVGVIHVSALCCLAIMSLYSYYAVCPEN